MNDSTVPPTSYEDASDEKSQAGYEAGSLVATIDAPVNETELKPRRAIGIVMISQLSELPVHFGDGDKGNPRNWVPKRKIAIALFVVMGGFVANFGIPVYISGIPSISADFDVGSTLAILPGSLYAYGLGIGAFIASAASEIFGRSIVYRVTLPLCLIFTILGGAAHNYSTLAAARFLAGTMAGPCLTIGVGVMNDIWNISLEKAGTTFAALYALMLVYATQVGPMVSGSLITHHSWRWSFWITTILIGPLVVAAFLIPETHGLQILRSRAKKEHLLVAKRGELLAVFLVSVGRPLHMILVEPLVLLSGLVFALTQSIVFVYYVTYVILFEQVYNFSPYQVGLTFAPLFVGSLIAIPVLVAFDRLTYQKARVAAIRSGTEVKPEKRLYPAMLSAILLPISLFWLAWTGRPSVHWIIPALSGVLFGVAYVLNMICIAIYNNDVYAAHYSASAFAATTFLRFTISSSFPLFTAQMVHYLGFAWATSLLGFITVAMIPIPWVFFKWGPVLIRKSRYLQN